ncbi:MAG: beta-1,6-N-acetylglucosaminyltransferase [Bacteroidales bacterium]|nr:beta-1,6-N-acetylglucosaminyltransferase [Bacteroidales bacterium]
MNEATGTSIKHAFLITAHSYFGQLEEIIGLLSAPNHFFFINIDKKTKGGDVVMNVLKDKSPNVYFLEGSERMEVSHGGYSQIECTLRLLHKAYDTNCDYYHLISGQDYPCRPGKEFDKFFEEHYGYSFMAIEDEEYHEKCLDKEYSRVMPWYIKDFPRRDIKLIDWGVKLFNLISKHFYLRKPIPNLWGGWNWFSWHKSLAMFVIQQQTDNPRFFKRFHHTLCGDELIFSTLFHGKEAELKIINGDALRYINWTKKAEGRNQVGCPLILNEEEYEEIIRSGSFFCRKVHPEISKELLKLLRNNITQ